VWNSGLIEGLWERSYAALTVLLLMALLYQHWQIIVAVTPLDLYEGTMLLITGIIAEGGNPYTREFQPYAADVYPPLYNILVAPLSQLFGNTFQLHRAVSGVFILLSAALAGLATWRKSGSRLQGTAAGVMLYAALLFYATPVSSTNAPGVALFLAGLIIPWWRRFSNGSLVFGMLCGLLVFYTKQYFILGMAMLCLYLFLYVSISRALYLGFSYAGLLLASMYLVYQSSPYYFDNTFFAPAVAVNGLQTRDILSLQLSTYIRTYAGLLLAMLIPGIAQIAHTNSRAMVAYLSDRFIPQSRGWGGPLLAVPADFIWFCFLWATLVVVFWLGKNPGNYMTYLFQLMSPFLLIGGFSTVGALSGKWKIFTPLVLFSFYQAYDILHKDFSADMGNWARVERLVAQSDEILASQMLVKTLLQFDKKVYQDGHTFYFPLAENKPQWMRKERKEDRVSAVWDEYLEHLYRKIQNQEFELILVSPWEMRGIFLRHPPPFEDVSGKVFLSRYYVVSEKISLSMTDRHGGGTYNIMVWRPRPGSKKS